MSFSELLKVTIDFDQSHLFFPAIIHWLLIFIVLLLAYTQWWPKFKQTKDKKPQSSANKPPRDALRLLGTLALTIAYFFAMPLVGEHFPNTGLGFLFCSIPYVFLLSLIFLNDFKKKTLMTGTINALATPTLVWSILANLFNISLP